jgi:hypothetical protein
MDSVKSKEFLTGALLVKIEMLLGLLCSETNRIRLKIDGHYRFVSRANFRCLGNKFSINFFVQNLV